jgi:hypothetical protein
MNMKKTYENPGVRPSGQTKKKEQKNTRSDAEADHSA